MCESYTPTSTRISSFQKERANKLHGRNLKLAWLAKHQTSTAWPRWVELSNTSMRLRNDSPMAPCGLFRRWYLTTHSKQLTSARLCNSASISPRARWNHSLAHQTGLLQSCLLARLQKQSASSRLAPRIHEVQRCRGRHACRQIQNRWWCLCHHHGQRLWLK